MARQPRFVLPGHPQHMTQRGNNRDVIFAAQDDDDFYLESLAEALGKSPEQRQEFYRGLFVPEIPENTFSALRGATQNCWVLGNDKLKAQIERLTQRQASPKSRGGDRKSDNFKKQGSHTQ